GQDTRLANDADEIGVTQPARNDMEMEVLSDACTGSGSEIHSQIEAVGTIQLLQGADDSLRKLHHFRQLLGPRQSERVQVFVWRNHRMAGRIGEQIQNNEVMSASENDQPFGVVTGVLLDAKDTSGGFPPR